MKPKTISQDTESKIIMQGVHLELTDAMKNAVHEKVGRLLTRNERIVRINVRIRQDQQLGTEHHYTVTGQIEINGPDLVATVEGKEVYDLIDQLSEKLDHLLHRRHGLRKDHRNHPHDVELDARLPKLDDGEEA